MKHLRQRFVLLICSCLILLPWAPLNVRAQDNPDDGKKVFDTYATVTTYVYPVAGAMFKATGEMLDLFGYFGNKPDPVGEALKRINQRLDNLELKVATLEAQIQQLTNDEFRSQNRSRIRFLKDRHQELQHLADELREKPTEKARKRTLANDAQRIAGRFLNDPEMDIWKWNDLRERDQLMLPADFKPLPALEYYVVALVTWMAAIENAAEGDSEFAKREYGRELQKHIAFLSVRPGWTDTDEAEALPENIMTRVSCTLQPLERQSRDRKCQIAESCEDQLARVSRTIKIHEVIMPLNSDLCNVPPGATARGSEDEMERMYGTEVMEKLAKKLEQLKVTGSVREQFIGTFDPTKYTAQYLYGVKPNGELLWYQHRMATRKAGGPSPTGQGNPIERARKHGTRTSEAQPGAGPSARKLGPILTLVIGTEKFEITHFLDSPKAVGSGWGDFKELFSGGDGIVYAIARDGKLLWYKHRDFGIGARSWEGAKEIGHGWGAFKQVFSGGGGVIYAMTEEGKLLWYKHNGYLDGRGLGSPGAWEGPKEVGSGWNSFKQVFPGGNGIVYAITQDGKLLWYRHIDFANGVKAWEGPKVVGTGWQSFDRVFSPGEGVIYAMRPTGELLWYKHNGYKDGSIAWLDPVEVAADWKDFLFVFPNMAGSWTPPVVR